MNNLYLYESTRTVSYQIENQCTSQEILGKKKTQCTNRRVTFKLLDPSEAEGAAHEVLGKYQQVVHSPKITLCEPVEEMPR